MEPPFFIAAEQADINEMCLVAKGLGTSSIEMSGLGHSGFVKISLDLLIGGTHETRSD